MDSSSEDDKGSDSGEKPHFHHCARKILEESIAMPFFKDNKDHMPVILNLHAGLTDEGDYYLLKTSIPCLGEDDVKVSAGEHNIDVFLTSGAEEEKSQDKEFDHFEDPSFHSSYYLKDEVDPKSLEYTFKEETLKIKVTKKG
ncbi:MAG: Hsp20/alpha crystallin family protein [Candidatus Altiarchaeota archaeon]